MDGKEQGWYRMLITNSNGTESKARVRLTKDDFEVFKEILESNKDKIEAIYTWRYNCSNKSDECVYDDSWY